MLMQQTVRDVIFRTRNYNRAAAQLSKQLLELALRHWGRDAGCRQEVEDLTQSLMVRLLEEDPASPGLVGLMELLDRAHAGEDVDVEVWRYLSAALKRRGYNLLRSRKRQVNFSDLARQDDEGDERQVDPEQTMWAEQPELVTQREKREDRDALLKETMDPLRRVMDHISKGKGKGTAYATRLGQDLTAGVLLGLGVVDMEQWLQTQHGISWHDPRRKTQQNCLLKRLQRLRDRLEDGIGELEQEGGMSPAQAAQARDVLARLLYRRRGAGARPKNAAARMATVAGTPLTAGA